MIQVRFLPAAEAELLHETDYYSKARKGFGVRFKDAERNDVDEYCISEGWIRVALGKKVDRKGAALTIKLTGPVEVWYRDEPKAAD